MLERPRAPYERVLRSSRLVTGLVTVFLLRADFRWLTVAKLKPREGYESPATDTVWLVVTYLLTGATGLEPATSGVTGRRSNQLSYAPSRGNDKYGRAKAQLCPRPRV